MQTSLWSIKSNGSSKSNGSFKRTARGVPLFDFAEEVGGHGAHDKQGRAKENEPAKLSPAAETFRGECGEDHGGEDGQGRAYYHPQDKVVGAW